MKLKFSIRSALLLSATLFVFLVCGNKFVDYRVQQIESSYAFEPEQGVPYDPITETPKINRIAVQSNPSIFDYLLFRRTAKLECEVELIYSGEYGGGLLHRQPGVPDTKIQCYDHYSVGLFHQYRTAYYNYQIGWTEMNDVWIERSKHKLGYDTHVLDVDSKALLPNGPQSLNLYDISDSHFNEHGGIRSK